MLPQASVTINVYVRSFTSPSGKFVWKYLDDATYSSEISFTTRAVANTAALDDATDIMLLDPPQSPIAYLATGNPQTETGIRVFFDSAADIYPGDIYTFTVTRAAGYHYVKSNDNSLHQMTQCSSRGTCDSTTGRCNCFVGYGGEACQRSTCPNDCSGHGICQSGYQFRQDAIALGSLTSTITYGAVTNYYTEPHDAQRILGCKCDNGYRGPDCSLIECPSGVDPLVTTSTEEANEVARDCSGRGICDYSAGQCKCFKGYFGERCESQTNFV